MDRLSWLASSWWTGGGVNLNLLSMSNREKLNQKCFSKLGDGWCYKKKDARLDVEMKMKIEKGQRKGKRKDKIEEEEIRSYEQGQGNRQRKKEFHKNRKPSIPLSILMLAQGAVVVSRSLQLKQNKF